MASFSHNTEKTGSLEVICGPMFAGKSEELIRRLRRAMIAKQKTGVFKHAFDNQRCSAELVVAHSGITLQALSVETPEALLSVAASEAIEVVGLDEVQYFGNDVIPVICMLVGQGKRVIVAGLDTDFRGLPFGPMPSLLAMADVVLKLQAICAECGNNATCTQRLVDGKPAPYNGPLILVGAQEAYQARCRGCYRIDQKPALSTMFVGK